jgi:hypothetical protein
MMVILAEKAGIDPFEFDGAISAACERISTLSFRPYPMQEIMEKMPPITKKL